MKISFIRMLVKVIGMELRTETPWKFDKKLATLAFSNKWLRRFLSSNNMKNVNYHSKQIPIADDILEASRKECIKEAEGYTLGKNLLSLTKNNHRMGHIAS